MGARDRRLGRAISRTLLLLFVALASAVSGAIPGNPAGAAKKTPPGDPPGNNGTVKIDQSDQADEDKGNEPIGDNCSFWLKFYNFDTGQKADISFAAHPPTGGKDPIVYPDVLISDDAAGGGADEDAVVAYNLTDYVRGLEKHPQHGYHIKLTTTIQNADGSFVPGGVKHKVFWINCTPPPAEETPAQQAASTLRIAKEQVGNGQGPFKFSLVCTHSPLDREFTLKAGEKLDITDVPPGTTCDVKETDKKGAESTVTEDPAFGEPTDGIVRTTAEQSTIVTFKNKFPGDQVIAAPPDEDIRPPAGTPESSGGTPESSGGTSGGSGDPGAAVGGANEAKNPGSEVLAAAETAPEAAAATLPRTGGDPWPLTVTGLSALAAGAALLAGGRRRRV